MTENWFVGGFSVWSCIWQSTVLVGAGLIGSFILRHRAARAHHILLLSMIAAVVGPDAAQAIHALKHALADSEDHVELPPKR